MFRISNPNPKSHIPQSGLRELEIYYLQVCLPATRIPKARFVGCGMENLQIINFKLPQCGPATRIAGVCIASSQIRNKNLFLYLPSLLCFELLLELKASCHNFKALFKRLVTEFVLPNLSILQVFETVASKR